MPTPIGRAVENLREQIDRLVFLTRLPAQREKILGQKFCVQKQEQTMSTLQITDGGLDVRNPLRVVGDGEDAETLPAEFGAMQVL